MLVKEKAPEIGLATVYRTLELLSELHVVENQLRRRCSAL